MSQTEKTEKAEKLLQFSQRLKQVAGKHGLKQSQIAEALGITPSTVGQWFHANNFPGPSVEHRLADLLEIPLDWLLTGKTEKPEKPDTSLSDRTSKVDRNVTRHVPISQRMQINPAYTPTENPTREDVENYIRAYLDLAAKLPGATSHAYIELTDALPLEKLRKKVEKQGT